MTKVIKLKGYLDTSVVSALFDNRNPERKALTEAFFEQSDHIEIYRSDLTLAEIARVSTQNMREKMQRFTRPFLVLESNEEVNVLTDELIQHGAVPQNSIEDAYHIAIAVVFGMDYLLSWNFRHLVRLKTIDVVRMVTTLKGYRPIQIVAPAELI